MTASLQKGKDGSALGFHGIDSRSFSTGTLKYLAGVSAAAVLALSPFAAGWQQWQTVAGVYDLGGPRSDGSLVVGGSAELSTITTDGALSPLARNEDPGAEAYLVVSAGTGCFAKDDTFVLRLHAPIGVTRVSADGSSTAPFADVGLSSLNGIAFDTTGSFDRRLLVTGPVSGKTEVVAIDCTGAVQVVTKSAPTVEGGVAVAPQGFGEFGGDLIAPDELTGLVWAIAPDGSARQVVTSGLPAGQDTGVESIGFVPAGFATRGGYVYYSDRSTPGNPHPGTDHVLRLSSADLVAAGVEDGDLLAATEGGASMIGVRCNPACHVSSVVPLPTSAHGEGHLVFTLTPQPPSPVATAVQAAYSPPSRGGFPIAAVIVLIGGTLVGGALAVLLARRRRGR